MAVETSDKPNLPHDFEDDDDGPVIYKRYSSSKKNQLHSEVSTAIIQLLKVLECTSHTNPGKENEVSINHQTSSYKFQKQTSSDNTKITSFVQHYMTGDFNCNKREKYLINSRSNENIIRNEPKNYLNHSQLKVLI